MYILPANLSGRLHGCLFYRFNCPGRLSQPTDRFSQGFCRTGRTRQNIYRLVLWLQVAPGHQRSGELLSVYLTPGNVDDRIPVPKLLRKLFGKVFGDKGYISQPLRDLLLQTFGIQLITKLRSNAKNQLPMPLMDRILLRKRAIVESVIDQLKNISQIEHSRHRSVTNFLVNLLCGLIAYAHQPKKPSLGREALACLSA